jgi:histone-lysine N-methyltransferase SETD3
MYGIPKWHSMIWHGSGGSADGMTAVCCFVAGWALAVVSSRAFRVAGPQAPAALLPLIDMANHSFEPNCEVLPVSGGVAMVAKRPVRKRC